MIPFVAVDLFVHGSKLSEFIQSWSAFNTLLLIPNEFGTVFELGVQRLETLEELEIQYSQALVKPERETNSHNRLLEAFTFKATRIAICLLPFLYRCSPLYRNINSTTSLVQRTTVRMWRWFHGLVFLILTTNATYSQVLAKPEQQKISHNRLFIEALTLSRLAATRIKSVYSSFPPQAYRNYILSRF